ncbi:GNAT family N-acetyltransferase [Heyndrickxia sporothermodurans]
MSLRIREVTAENWLETALLSVEDDQKDFIESNSFSIAQSIFEPEWKSVSLYDEEILVGYAMYGNNSWNDGVWLDRFMIDKRFQGKGYAKRFLPMLIEHIRKLYHCNKIYLSVSEENKVAIALYERFGFQLNGEVDDSGVVVGLVMELAF